MKKITGPEVWFVIGSQHLYGEKTLQQVASNAQTIAEHLDRSTLIPARVSIKPVLTTPEAIYNLCQQANTDSKCIGLITWMHTFSPAKMWIRGLKILSKPFLHLHTQFNRDIPWDSINMDFMNLNQAAHGDREYGHIVSRMRINRKVVVGFWKDENIIQQVACWTRAAMAWNEWQGMKVARFGDNMRDVAVTEGDKVEAQIKFGFSVNGYGVGDLVAGINSVSENKIREVLADYDKQYTISSDLKEKRKDDLFEAARIEAGMRAFLEGSSFKAFTTTFEDLHGLRQLPGLAVQRLMAEGYGFGAEGDWKTAALVRAMKVMNTGLDGGTSFMEDYTYHLDPSGMKVLGAHMLEVCPTISSGKPSMEIHPLSIGGKSDPVRLVFDVKEGDGINVCLVDLGNRFRMIANPCKVVPAREKLPNLPVARALWVPEPDLQTAACAWIYAGGAHHTGFSTAVNAEMMEDFADMAGIEFMLIDNDTNLRQFKKELRWGDN